MAPEFAPMERTPGNDQEMKLKALIDSERAVLEKKEDGLDEALVVTSEVMSDLVRSKSKSAQVEKLLGDKELSK